MDVLMDPIVKYGFAGFAAILLGILVWVIRQLFASNRREAEVITANTDALKCLKDTIRDLLEVDREIRERLRYGDDPRSVPRPPPFRLRPRDNRGPDPTVSGGGG